jgi:hypothetical protein
MSNTLASHGPALFIELHGAELSNEISNAIAVMELLEQAGYRVLGVENGKYLTSTTVDSRPPSHVYCTRER